MLNPIKNEWMNTWINKIITDEGSCCHFVAQSCLTLYDPLDCSPPGSSVHGFSRQEYWSGLPFPPPGDLPDPGIEPESPALQVDSLPLSHQGSPVKGSTAARNRSTLSWIIYWAPGYRDACTYPSAFITEGNIADMVRACLWSRELLFLIPWSLLCMLLLYKNIWQSTRSCLELGGVWTLNGINV